MYDVFGYLFNTFVTERKHKDPKHFAFDNRSKVMYEKGLMEELCCQHLYDWKNFKVAHVSSPQPLSKQMQNRCTEIFPGATRIEIAVEFVNELGAKFHSGDLALLGGSRRPQCGIIWYHFVVDGVWWSCVAVWPFLKLKSDRCAIHNVVEDPQTVRCEDLSCLALYRMSAGGERAMVIWPRAYR